MLQLKVILGCVAMLILSNVFQNLAWYGHLNRLGGKPLWVVILVSWGIALFEYTLMVPANRYAYEFGGLSVAQMKIIQEVITLSVFIPLSLMFFGEKWNWDYLLAALCMVGAVFFSFRAKIF